MGASGRSKKNRNPVKLSEIAETQRRRQRQQRETSYETDSAFQRDDAEEVGLSRLHALLVSALRRAAH